MATGFFVVGYCFNIKRIPWPRKKQLFQYQLCMLLYVLNFKLLNLLRIFYEISLFVRIVPNKFKIIIITNFNKISSLVLGKMDSNSETSQIDRISYYQCPSSLESFQFKIIILSRDWHSSKLVHSSKCMNVNYAQSITLSCGH